MSEDIFTQKKILRKEMRIKRSEFSREELEKASHGIISKLLAHPAYLNAKSVMAYESMPEEIQLREFFEDCFAKGKKVSIPFIVGRGNLRPVLLPAIDALEVGDFGILTVRKDLRKFADMNELDCVIVPGAAFDVHGNRLGLGGGYYDRFLKLVPNAKKIALACDFQVKEDLPITPQDSAVDIVITPTRIIEVG